LTREAVEWRTVVRQIEPKVQELLVPLLDYATLGNTAGGAKTAIFHVLDLGLAFIAGLSDRSLLRS
jgi:hypothetical protein